jgi:hypothetical protein
MHLKYIAKYKKEFISYLTQIFNKLCDSVEFIEVIPILYKFRAIFIPKGNA